MMEWCPFATKTVSPNFQMGRGGHAVKAVVMHVAQGPGQQSIDWLCSTASGASAHFLIDTDGSITQMVSIANTAWGNGLSFNNTDGTWINPQGHVVAPTWSGIQPGVNPNLTTISVEHAGFSGDPWTDAMLFSNSRLLAWIASQTGLVYAHGTTLIGHNDLDNVDRAHCPGPVDYNAIVAGGNDPDLQAWGTDFPYHPTWLIATAWRNAGRPGKATCTPFTDSANATWQTFERAAVRYHLGTGAVVYHT